MQTVWLEFKREGATQLAALGTDTTFYIDGRWSWNTTRERIYSRVEELRDTYPHYREMLFVGITYSQHPFYNGKGGAVHTMKDRDNPPEWAKCDSCGAVQGTPKYDNYHDSQNCWAERRANNA
jgi:hypothetical protein